MAERSEDAKLGATEVAIKRALVEAAKHVRTPEQIALLSDDARDEALARQPDPVTGVAPLFPVDRRPDDGGEHEAASVGADGIRRKGRPPGARNKATSATRQYILATIGDPLTMLARRGMEDPVALALRLGCSPLEAFNAQNTALAKCLPFVHSPQPAALKIEGKGALALMFSGVPMDQSGDEEAEGSDWEALEAMANRIGQDREQNQGVSVTDIEPSNVSFANVEPKKQGGSDA